MTVTSAHPLATLFQPRSVAIVGASEKSAWTRVIASSMEAFGVRSPMYAVNRSGSDACGMKGFTSCTAIPDKVDAAYLCVPQEGIREALEDVARAGIRNVVVLTSGYGEAGPEGKQQERDLVAQADQHGIRMLGPNCMGFANLAAGAALTSINPRGQVLPDGKIGIVSQSGATTVEILEFTQQQGVAVSFFTATGNEAQISSADVIDYLVDDPGTKVILAFLETVRNPARFVSAAKRALERGKPIVICKVGASEISASVAQAHTGSLVGDDRVFSAVCLQYGVIRVRTIEELVITGAFLAQTGELAPGGLGVASISGGACTLIGDIAEAAGVPLPAFTPETVTALRGALPGYASVLNPLDITGAAVRDVTIFENSLAIVGRDPNIAVTLAILNLPNVEGVNTPSRTMLAAVGSGLRASSKPGLLAVQTIKPITEVSRRTMQECGIPGVTGGLDHAVRAAGQAIWWSAQRRQRRERSAGTGAGARPLGRDQTSEREVVDYLAASGVPVIPSLVVKTATEAAAHAEQVGGRVALKVASPDIAHKTEVGGVKLRLEGKESVAQAFNEILASVQAAAPAARIDGVLVSPMRERGIELFVGTARDADWGAVIAVGVGGIWVEALRDTAVRVLPVDRGDVLDMLHSLRAARILQGFRGAPAADLVAVADVVVKVGAAALNLGPDLASLEINPLLVDGERVEALDGLVTWNA